ncbi:hypothetical protein tinsulaeT_06170 [Thalassotalea insulae]|uniref:DUF2884 family protein n=1 Tax=Thalassotalea insulae TaxID=2056778 RepID=A0ABQ6GMX0_9GAMM|nr:hypothetical protein [Thalassotalea insulae]GLX77277.1 hypothetical protein tinsulaeT_06170 [Thalassotalea insulae]
MHTLSLSKITLSAVSSLTFIALLAISSPNVQADIVHHHADNDQVIIHSAANNKDPLYIVNGKSFHFSELSPAQQAEIKVIQDKLTAVEQEFDRYQDKIDKISAQLEQKAHVIEKEVRKLEQASIPYGKSKISLQDLSTIAQQLTSLANLDDELMQQKQKEMAVLEQQLDAVDWSLVDDIERHANALEQVLITIAKEI